MTMQRTGVAAEILSAIGTPDQVTSRIGPLEFDDGAPSQATADLVYDHWDFVNAVKAFVDGYAGASLVALREGFHSVGVKDNEILLFSELMDSASVFLTANTDTIYALGFVDLSDGPVVVDVPAIPAPSGFLGTVDDMWFRWVTDMGLPGPDRGTGGRYLLVGPGYDGPLPEGGFYVSHSPHDASDPAAPGIHDRQRPGDRARRDPIGASDLAVHAGRRGHLVAAFLAGDAPSPPRSRLVKRGSSRARTSPSTRVPQNDWSFWEKLHRAHSGRARRVG